MVGATLLTLSDIKSALSIAYVQAVAARAGYTCGEPPGPDRDSIDLQIADGGLMRPKIDLQLKATAGLKTSENGFSYELIIKNYNDLRTDTQTPRILVILDLPDDEDEWLKISDQELIMRKAAYWISLKGQPDSENSSSITIKISKDNLFDVDALKTLMEQSRQGVL